MFTPTNLEELWFIKKNNSFVINLPLANEWWEIVYENWNFSIDCSNEWWYNWTSLPLFPESIDDIKTLIRLLSPNN